MDNAVFNDRMREGDGSAKLAIMIEVTCCGWVLRKHHFCAKGPKCSCSWQNNNGLAPHPTDIPTPLVTC